MARRRFLHPGFFHDECLVTLEPIVRLLFAGLWCLADRDGRLEDRPIRIKMQLFPVDHVDVDAALTALADGGLVTRYTCDGRPYLQIRNFLRYQTPHPNERGSGIPGPPSSTNGTHADDDGTHTDANGTRADNQGALDGQPTAPPIPSQGTRQGLSTPHEPLNGTTMPAQGTRAGTIGTRAECGYSGPSDTQDLRSVGDTGRSPGGAPDQPHSPPGRRAKPLSYRPRIDVAWPGRPPVPGSLHAEFRDKLGGDPDEADAALRAWYPEAAAPYENQPIGDDDFAFWRARFREWVGTTRQPVRVTPADTGGPGYRCHHDPPCRRTQECIARYLEEERAARKEATA